MKDKSILIIIAVLLLGAIAFGTGLRRVPNPDGGWYAGWHFGDRAEERGSGREWDGDWTAEETSGDAGATTTEGDRTEIAGLDAERAEVQLMQAAGRLRVRGESGPLMSARFDVRPDELKPEVSMRTEDGVGRLTVETPDFDPFAHGEYRRNDWDVALTTDKPLDLTVECGAGESTLRLGELDLGALRVVTGAGSALIDLTGRDALDEVVDVDIDGGVGQVEIVLPSDVPVRVSVDQGIGDVSAGSGLMRDGGDWVNEAYRSGGPAYEIRIQQGIGEVSLRLAD